MLAVTILVILGVIAAYRILFIRTVNYNIGGINIPAKYNILTGRAVPIKNYSGKDIKATVTDSRSDKMGFDENDATAAQFRWALFDAWVKSRPEYKGWESNREIFEKANEEYKNKIRSGVQVIR